MTDETGTSGWPAPPIEKQRAARRGADVLTPDQVVIAFLDAVYDGKGELAAASFNETVALTDATQLIAALREQLRKAQLNAAAWELDCVGAQASEKHIGERLREAHDKLNRQDISRAHMKGEIRILTNALRDANEAVEAASQVMTDKQVAEAAEIQRRALAEIEEETITVEWNKCVVHGVAPCPICGTVEREESDG